MAVYFASDVHLGLNFGEFSPVEREKKFASWLLSIQNDCTELFLVGDVFDFFFEWKRVVPKGYFRTFAALATLAESGIKIHFFPGNHDLWVRDYFEKELGIIVHREPFVGVIDGRKFFIAHGDIFYRHNFIGRAFSFFFRNLTVRKIASKLIHPNSMVRFGQWWSRSNRLSRGYVAHIFGGEEDFLVKYARQYLATIDSDIDCFLFGHEHTPVIYWLTDRSRLVILGEWVERPVVACLEHSRLRLVDINL